MSTSGAVLTQGTVLQREDPASPGSFITIPETHNISGPTASKPEIPVTDFASTGQEFKGALPDFGSLTFDLFYNGTLAIHAALLADFSSGSSPVRNFKMIFVNGKQYTFAAYVSAFPFTIEANNVVRVSASLRLSGAFVEA